MTPPDPASAPRPSVSLAAAVNNAAVLDNCLRRSPDVAAGALPLRIYEGYASASRAYNAALNDSSADIVILAHQDVYLPTGFLDHFLSQIDRLNVLDPDWAVIGTIGLDRDGQLVGRTWSSGLQRELGALLDQPAPAATMDELLIAVRKASMFRFDDALPGFHLYAADAVEIARATGRSSYIIDAPTIHHSRPVVKLDAGYRRAYRYMQTKWANNLPIPNLVCPIRRSSLTLNYRDARIRWRRRGRERPPEPMDDPSLIARRLGLEPGPGA